MKSHPSDSHPKNQIKGASCDKIAPHQRMTDEVNKLSLAEAAAMSKYQSGKTDGRQLKELELELEKLEKGSKSRDIMAICSAIFCSPLMLFGIGSALALSDEMRLGKMTGLNNKINAMRRGLFYRGTSDSDRLAKERQIASRAWQSDAARSKADQIFENVTKKKLHKNDSKPHKYYQDKQSELESKKDWVKASKLLKRKQALMDWLEKNRGKLELETVSEIAANIELLDKELKNLGC